MAASLWLFLGGASAGGGVGERRGAGLAAGGGGRGLPSQTCGGPTSLKGAEQGVSVPSLRRDGCGWVRWGHKDLVAGHDKSLAHLLYVCLYGRVDETLLKEANKLSRLDNGFMGQREVV